MIVDSYLSRVKRDRLQNSFNNATYFVRYFSGAKTQHLQHYIVPSLLNILVWTNWQMK